MNINITLAGPMSLATLAETLRDIAEMVENGQMHGYAHIVEENVIAGAWHISK